MHLFDAATRFYGGNAIVGGGLPVATGLALAAHMQGQRTVTACFFGEGAMAEGDFHECMNLAALWRLPVLFCCGEQPLRNGHRARSLGVRDESGRQSGRLRDAGLDGRRHGRARRTRRGPPRHHRDVAGDGPAFLELQTYRFRAHSMYDPERYRSKEEVTSWRS